MVESNQNSLDFIFNFSLFIISLFAVYFQISPPQNQKEQVISMIYFVGVILAIAVSFIAIWLQKKIQFYIELILRNTEDIKNLKEAVSMENRFSELNKRLVRVEVFHEKGGEIEPKWILLAFVLVLFYLYLRSLGLVR